jgi:predicted Fe-Mo cluster-binding NifX family protein
MTAPKEDAALKALQAVQSLQPKALDALITSEIGTPMLGVFSSLVRAGNPGASADVVARQVHLMVLAYLMRRETEHAR